MKSKKKKREKDENEENKDIGRNVIAMHRNIVVPLKDGP